MHGFIKIVILLTCMGVFWCFSDSFLVTEKPQRPRSAQQLKQDIIEVMGTLVEQESIAIETKAQIQRAFFNHIKACADGDKKSLFTRASTKQLQQVLKTLRQEEERYRKEQVEHKRLLAFVRSHMIT